VTGARPGHTKRCHLANPDQIYEAEVLPEIAPDLVALVVEDAAATNVPDGAAPGGAIAPENR
jgi:peptide/nickel transport system ATP-binding protein